jgi:hypothetical protein
LTQSLPRATIFIQSIEVIMLPYLFVVFAVLFRFMPHQYGFAPVVASLLFFGAHQSRKRMWIPVMLLIASDILLNKFVYAYPLAADQYITWVWYGAIALLGTTLQKNPSWLRILGTALASSVSFFLISNFGVWAVYNMYPKTLQGLMICYEVGLPFFRRAFEGDMLFTAAMFATPIAMRAISGALDKTGHPTAAA